MGNVLVVHRARQVFPLSRLLVPRRRYLNIKRTSYATISHALTALCVSRLYPRLSNALIESLGGRRVRCDNALSGVGGLLTLLCPGTTGCDPVPQISQDVVLVSPQSPTSHDLDRMDAKTVPTWPLCPATLDRKRSPVRL